MYSPRYVIVRYGSTGEQLAVLTDINFAGPRGTLYYRVRKYLRNSHRWTGVVRIAPAHLLRAATPAEIQRAKTVPL